MSVLHDIADDCNCMHAGQALTFDRRELGPESPFTREPSLERFKGNLIGMCWGEFTVQEDPFSNKITVSRVGRNSPTKVWESWDRRMSL